MKQGQDKQSKQSVQQLFELYERLPEDEQREFREMQNGFNTLSKEAQHHLSDETIGTSTIGTIDDERNERVAAASRMNIFGELEPSVIEFRNYLVRLHSQVAPTIDDKREACKLVNFWKGRLNLELYYEGNKCTLTAKPDHAGGSYWLRHSGGKRRTIANFTKFPKVTCRKKTKTS